MQWTVQMPAMGWYTFDHNLATWDYLVTVRTDDGELFGTQTVKERNRLVVFLDPGRYHVTVAPL